MNSLLVNTLEILIDDYKTKHGIKENIGDVINELPSYVFYCGDLLSKNCEDPNILVYKFEDLYMLIDSKTRKVLQFQLGFRGKIND